MQPTQQMFIVIWFLFFNTQILLGGVLLYLTPEASPDLIRGFGSIGDALSGFAGLLWILGWLTPRWASRLGRGDRSPAQRAFLPFILQLAIFEMVGIVGMVAGILNSPPIGVGLIAASVLGIGLCFPSESRLERLAGK